MSKLIANLIESLCNLPGVGPKSAQRMAYHLLERNRDAARAIVKDLDLAVERVKNCSFCRDLSEDDICEICSDARRDVRQLCIVEMPADVIAIEQAASYRGLFFVLMGRLSPLDGIGPEEIGIPKLTNRLGAGDIDEIIIATNTTVEGEATAQYIAKLAGNNSIKATRIAHGVPMGGELEYIDTTTLAWAINSRTIIA